MTDPDTIPTGFPKRTRNIYFLIIAIVTVFYIGLYLYLFERGEYREAGASVPLFFMITGLTWLVFAPLLGFILGLVVAVLPYKNNPYRKKYLRASLLGWMSVFILWPISMLLFLIIDPLQPEQCDCADKTKQDSIAAFDAAQYTTLKNFYELADQKNKDAIPAIDSVLAMTDEKLLKEKHVFLDNEGKLELHYLDGTLYYNDDDYVYALKEFGASDNDDFVKARAACYIQLKRYIVAEALLRSQLKFNTGLNSSLGNLFEVTGNVDSAKAAYQRVYDADLKRAGGKFTSDQTFCSFCIERLNELAKTHPVLLTEFSFPSHRP